MKTLLLLLILFITTPVMAQDTGCHGVVKNVFQDENFGSIVVETEYVLNGQVVQLGRSRYDENSGTIEEIKIKAMQDIEEHCQKLIMRIPENMTSIQTEKLKIAKELTASLLNPLKTDLVNQKSNIITNANINFKNKIIGVTHDKTTSVSNNP